MYQTVGHHAIDCYKEAMGLPLYRRTIEGASIELGKDYVKNEEDEVEDLYQLLKTVMDDIHVDAVSVGAILSDYQRVRVENVCMRLGLTSLAYLWRRDQTTLLNEMIASGVEAVIIKVAAMGLKPTPHLGMSLAKIHPIMLNLESKYGLNVCGEGGEFETFTLDCPLFNKKIVVDEVETIIHSDDTISPVGYLNFTKMHLEEKDHDFIKLSHSDRIKMLPMKTSGLICRELGLSPPPDLPPAGDVPKPSVSSSQREPSQPSCRIVSCDDDILVSNIFGMALRSDSDSVESATKTAMDNLRDALVSCDLTLGAVFMMHLYVKDMSQFALINGVYKQYFGINPPARICVEADLPEKMLLQIDCIACRCERSTMHVQGLSHWAPANIGPYSQAVTIGSKVYVAGQIALCPATMKIIDGGIKAESRLSLRHVQRILAAKHPGLLLHGVTMGICYVTSSSSIPDVEAEWEKALEDERAVEDFISGDSVPLLQVVVVSGLPRGALVEWQVVASVPGAEDDKLFDMESLTPLHSEDNIKEIALEGLKYRCILRQRGTPSNRWLHLAFTDTLDNISEGDRLHAFDHLLRRAHLLPQFSKRAVVFIRTDAYQYADLLQVLTNQSAHLDMPSWTLVPVRGFQQRESVISICG
ncbi:uncharacterized protein LOC135485670 isoform X2 [Lineus longissimus]